jgi:hypothetical protein
MRRKIIIYMLVCTLVFPTFLGVVSSSNTQVVKSLSKVTVDRSSSHTILGEFATLTTCEPCKYAHRALKNLFAGGWHPFYYLTLVKDANKKAEQRYNELGIQVTPTVEWDGGFRKDEAAVNVDEAQARYNTSMILAGNRDVADIDLSLNVTWQGAVNPDPADGATGVVVEKNMSWTDTAMDINYQIHNNAASQYNGHLHVYVTEVNSSYWIDKFGDPYTFAFLDYAFNGDVSISAGGTVTESTTWDGKAHDDGYGMFFDQIRQDNAMVIASVFDPNSHYTDETAGFRAGVGTDPKRYDIYFGNTNPPPKLMSNTTVRSYNPPGNLGFNTTYYWKIDVWDNKGNPKYGPIWHFTTRANHPPTTPYNPNPVNNSLGVFINTNISWWGGDIDFDSVTYDVYFGQNKLFLPKVASNISVTTYDPAPFGNLNFSTKYYWKIVAWDQYGLKATAAPIWNFMTQGNLPPDTPFNPFPEDLAHNVPTTGVILSWNGSDPNPGDNLRYCVYFEEGNPTPHLVSNNQTGTTYTPPGDLQLYRTYYWRIVAWDSGKLSKSSPPWSFTTGINDKPNPPVITGLTTVTAGKEYEYTFNAIDPNGDDIYYFIDWGDQTNTGWIGKYTQGVDVMVNHTWAKKGTYTIKAKAKDVWGAEGDYGTLTVTVPLNLQSIQQSSKPLHLKTLNKNTISYQVLVARLMGLS